MKIIFKILFSIYYLFLITYIILWSFSFSSETLIGGEVFHHQKNIEIVYIFFYVFFLIIGLMNLGDKYLRWFSKKIILLLIFSFVAWLLISFLILYSNDYSIYYFLFLTLPIVPCFINNIWFYLNFEKATYSFDSFDNEELISYDQIFGLDLPFLKIIKKDENILKLVLSVPYSLSKLFGIPFITLWIAIWTFASTIFFLEYPLAVFMYIPLIIPIYMLITVYCTRLYLTIMPDGVELRRSPIKSILKIKNLNDLELKYACASRGGCQYFIINKINNNYITLRNKEIVYLIMNILEVHLYLENTKNIRLKH